MHSLLVYTILGFFLALNLGCAVIQIGLLRRRAGWPRWLAALIILWTATMIGLLCFQFQLPESWKPWVRHWLYFPLSVEMVWNLLFVQVYALGLIAVTLGLRWFHPTTGPKASPPPDPSRRRFIYTLALGAMPAAALGMGVHGTLTRHDLRVRQLLMKIPGLPAGLEGFTIAHVSDPHSGIFCGPERLKIIGDAINDVKADLIAVTGDIINSSFAEFPDALVMLQRLRAPHGLYLCEGNHDVMAGPGVIGRACRENGLPWLYNSGVALPVNGCRLLLAGLPWMRGHLENRTDIVSALYPRRESNDLRILMAHHPHIFDMADSADLVLSGHTHGGQIMAGEVGLGPLFFRYWSGIYRRPGVETSLIVSNGCGDWFPCRVGAPAEIGLVRLTAG